ncbi:nuclear factor of kappa light polypeptide gene enhancer in B-cells inhibitor, alpha a [Chanos chanos]|uniref:NF-kappa-B inhibitor alpha n=1 Tax=Chanos chanos TaxID=29144 RepID=A0A6J2V1N3_CHACN|nr:NF-kappa-B inhibitor alpha-like [Chanos chanos]
MDVHGVSMDCNFDEMDLKNRKMLPTEDRFDSGVDSLKEDDIPIMVEDFTHLRVSAGEEPWKQEITEDGDTFLHLAIIHEAKEHALEMIKLSQNDPFLNKQNNQRQTALHLAVITEQPLIVERLLKAGCDPRLVDESGNTALHIACKKGSMTCFAVLTQIQTQHLRSILTFTNYSGHTCLHLASLYGYLSMVEVLVQLGADINAKEQCSGRTALHLAVDLQNPALVQRLISLGADVNRLTYGGFAPFHLTFGRQNTEIQKHLYERTAEALRELPESEYEDSEEEPSSDEEMYDDITFAGK